MVNRLSRIITRTGDKGATGLANGERASKNSPRIHVIGEIDELNSVLGLLRAEHLPETLRRMLLTIQNDLFDLGGEISLPGAKLIKKRQVEFLEEQAATLNANLPMLKEFILPGGGRAASLAHLARSVCRRAERALVALAESENGQERACQPESLRYLNRLSDFLFILARALNLEVGEKDVFWQKPMPDKP
ncbi:MAG: cob(I)yrinic acid a,c-diamide adenosyltransferase [Betaproteobacteria bacterium]|nr:cob(I)yrinic acid a,c-diamide adenosyltransferase [Betaproteobacteria bacterium]